MVLSRLPVTAILGTCLFLIGISAAAVAPYRAVVAVDNLGMTNALYALVVTPSSVGTALASLVMGYSSDRIPDRRLLVIFCAILGGVAYGLIYLVPTQLLYILSFCVILPFGGALFSQTFSFSRALYDLRRPGRAEFMMSALRTLFSVAWIVVPPVAGWLASAYSVFGVFAFFAGSVTDVLRLQGLNAVATAALLSITISYMQEAIRGCMDLSTAPMDVTTVVSVFIASAAFAALSSGENYKTVFVAASAVSLAGAGLIALSRAGSRASQEPGGQNETGWGEPKRRGR